MSFFTHAPLFLLGFSSLFPLVNPIGTALIINPMFKSIDTNTRRNYAITICFYCLVLGLSSLFAGSWFLRFMGVSIPVTQLAGGLVIAIMGFHLLNAQPQSEDHSSPQESLRDSLFYPLAFPVTVGPGCVSALITLSAHAHAASLEETFLRMGVFALSLFSVMVVTYFCIMYSHFVVKRMGKSGSIAVNRLMAFIVFSVGIQMIATGLTNLFPKLFG